jgi:hypothetical protein
VGGADGVATHFLKNAEAESLKPVRERRANAGVVVMIACALNLDGLSVEEKAFVGIELYGADTKRYALGVTRFSRSLDGDDGRIEGRRIR